MEVRLSPFLASTCAADEISCYHPGICCVLSNYSFFVAASTGLALISRRKVVDTRGGREAAGRGEGGEKNDVGPSREISNRTIRRAQGIETKSEGAPHFLIPVIASFQGGWLRDGCFPQTTQRRKKEQSMCKQKRIHL